MKEAVCPGDQDRIDRSVGRPAGPGLLRLPVVKNSRFVNVQRSVGIDNSGIQASVEADQKAEEQDEHHRVQAGVPFAA